MKFFLAIVTGLAIGCFIVIQTNIETSKVMAFAPVTTQVQGRRLSKSPVNYISTLMRPSSATSDVNPYTPSLMAMLRSAPPSVKIVYANFTAYDPYDSGCVGSNAYKFPHVTATGTTAEIPGLASDWRVFPVGTVVTIPDFGTFIVDDTGGQMRADAERGILHFDLRFPKNEGFRSQKEAELDAHRRAKEFGSHWMNVEVILPST